ncbi:MAG: GH74, partial [uncultured Solirubrobacteraceae bacterium]
EARAPHPRLAARGHRAGRLRRLGRRLRRGRQALEPPRGHPGQAAPGQRARHRPRRRRLPAHDQQGLLPDRPQDEEGRAGPRDDQRPGQVLDGRHLPRADGHGSEDPARIGPPRRRGVAPRLPGLHPLRRRRQELADPLAARRGGPPQDHRAAWPDLRVRRRPRRDADLRRRRAHVRRALHAARPRHRLRGRPEGPAVPARLDGGPALPLRGRRAEVARRAVGPGHAAHVAGAGHAAAGRQGRPRLPLEGPRADLRPDRQGARRALQVQDGRRAEPLPRALRRHDRRHDGRRQDVAGGVQPV